MIKRLYTHAVPEAWRAWLYRHRRHIPTAALVTGFLWDNLTLGRPDQFFDNAVMVFYLLLSGAAILIMSYRRERGQLTPPIALSIITQFSFGNLASGLFVLYSVSGTLAGNWFFFLVLAGLLIGNEFLRTRYGLLRFTVGVYYLLLLAYFIIAIPVLRREIGADIFILSGATSIVAIAFFLLAIHFLAPRVFAAQQRYLFLIISGIFVLFNVFFFFNIIPPVPLAAREIGIFHHVERTTSAGESAAYTVRFEKPKWYEFWKSSDNTFHFTPTSSAFCFSSVFAPAKLETPIFHRWEYFDEAAEQWRTASRISFAIAGGRDDGFRGFTKKSALFSGKWRCSVETERGSLIGRRSFELVPVTEEPELVSDVR